MLGHELYLLGRNALRLHLECVRNVRELFARVFLGQRLLGHVRKVVQRKLPAELLVSGHRGRERKRLVRCRDELFGDLHELVLGELRERCDVRAAMQRADGAAVDFRWRQLSLIGRRSFAIDSEDSILPRGRTLCGRPCNAAAAVPHSWGE